MTSSGPWHENAVVSRREIDQYLEALDETRQATLGRLRDDILAVIPDAEECISYTMPAFRVRGTVIAGFAAFKNHLSYLPHSGSVFAGLSEEVAPYRTSKGALQFPIDQPLPKSLVKKLLKVRMEEARSE